MVPIKTIVLQFVRSSMLRAYQNLPILAHPNNSSHHKPEPVYTPFPPPAPSFGACL